MKLPSPLHRTREWNTYATKIGEKWYNTKINVKK